MVDTRIENEVIYHLTNKSVQEGEITGKIDWERRRQLMDHHTAVHIVGGSARAILGPHIWQAGSNKGGRYARIDLTHYSRLLGMIWIRLKIMQMTSSQRILL